jgi:hypothetical protein
MALRALGTNGSQSSQAKRPLAPLFPLLAQGGLSAYEVHAEEITRAVRAYKRPIHTIIFPKSLKYHVLVHAVIAHEIGHAILSQFEVAKPITDAVDPLLSKGPLESPAKLQAHLKADNPAPPESIRRFREKAAADNKNVYNINLDKWRAEFLCDLLGLLIVGPSFLAALSTVLRGMNPSDSWGARHPPSESRLALLREVCRLRKWPDTALAEESKFLKAETHFWTSYMSPSDKWFSLHNVGALKQCVVDLEGILTERLSKGEEQGSRPLELYKQPAAGVMDPILDLISDVVPPTPRPKISDDESSLETPNAPIDFRYVLFGGWLIWKGGNGGVVEIDKNKLTFENINRLCHLSILQNRAIEIFHARSE